MPSMLAAPNRLKKKQEIDSVFRSGRIVHAGMLGIAFQKTEGSTVRVACSVGLKYSKLATRRNRLKRILRAAMKPFLSEISVGADLVIFVKGPLVSPPDQPHLQGVIESLLKRAQLLVSARTKH